MIDSIFLSIVIINLVFLFCVLFMAVLKPVFSQYASWMRYTLWKLIFICVPLSFLLLFFKTAFVDTVWQSNLIELSHQGETDRYTLSIRLDDHESVRVSQRDDGSQSPISMFSIAQSQSYNPLRLALTVGYFSGIPLFALVAVFRHYRYRKRIELWSDPPSERVLTVGNRLCKELHIRHAPEFVINSRILSPMLIGLKRQTVMIPEKGYAEKQLYLLLKHELVHYKAKDSFWKAVSILTTCLLWCNPVVYAADKLMDMECELSCDEQVVSYLPKRDRYAYGAMLIDFLEESAKSFPHFEVQLPMKGGYNQMAQRIERIASSSLPQKRGRGALTLSSAAILLFLAISNSFAVSTYSIKIESVSSTSVSIPFKEEERIPGNPNGMIPNILEFSSGA